MSTLPQQWPEFELHTLDEQRTGGRSSLWIPITSKSCSQTNDTWRLESGLTSVPAASNISQLHNNTEVSSSESVQVFESLKSASETALPPVDGHSLLVEQSRVAHIEPEEARHSSCPSILSVSLQSALRTPNQFLRRRGLSLCSLESAEEEDEAKASETRIAPDERMARIKDSLSKLSDSILLASRSIKQQAQSVPRHADSPLAQTGMVIKENLPALKRPDRHDSQRTTTSCTDLLSPVSSIAKDEDDARLRETLPLPPPIASPYQPSPKGTGLISQLRPQFSPSAAGAELMQIFKQDAPQDRMWTALVQAAASDQEFADSAGKMPTLVFCLRGLIRFGSGEFGSTRLDALAVLMAILTGRHWVADAPSYVEAVECAAAVLAQLAINPVTRRADFASFRSRASFESILTAQNGAVFQQVVMAMTQTIPKCLQLEREATASQTTRAVSGLLETMLVYGNNPALRASWLNPAPPQFKTTVALLLASVPQRFLSLLSRAVTVLDALLDELGGDQQLARQVAQALHSAIQRLPPHTAGEGMQAIRRWAGSGTTHHSSSVGRFFKSLSGRSKQSLKSTIYNEYQTLH